MARLGALVALLMVLTGCQVKLTVDTKVNANGSGTVAVGVGLDDEALAKAGDLSSQLRVDDLRASGWTVTGPTKEGDGYTWVRASKPFNDAAGATAVLDEVNGASGAFGGWKVSHGSSLLSDSYSVKGNIDLTSGMAAFTDPGLASALGGDPFGGAVAAIEQQQGRPVADMVDVRVTVQVPGGSRTYTPSLADAHPTAVHVASSNVTPSAMVLLTVAVLGLIVAGLVMVRRRSTRRRRIMR